MKKIVELKQLEKRIDEQTIIHPLTLDIEEGEFVTLLGPSGCGKTTLLRMIAGFEQPSSGDILLDEQSIVHVPPYRRDMNMVFQQYALFPHLTVEENILFGLKMKKVARAEQERRLAEVLEDTRLTHLRTRKPAQLSGGQQQRVAIARAIINQPKILLLDEPLGALDYELRKNLQLELKHLQKSLGITFIYVTHDQEEAMTMSDRIVIMNSGKVVQAGTPQEVYLRPQNVFVARFIGENNIIHQQEEYACIRPEHIRVSKPGEHHPDDEQTIRKKGRIRDAIFKGNQLKLFVQPDGEQEPMICYVTYQHDLWQADERVEISWEARHEVKLR
jgi:spermidine/putrescine transport system ATP-binding protein